MAATTQDYLEAAVLAISKGNGGTAPTGSLCAFAGTTIPDGWLLCNGAAVSRTTYANLFKAIGTTWGTGDGSTTFNLPDSNNRFLEATTDVSNVGKYLDAGLPNITGAIWNFATNGMYNTNNGCFYFNTSSTEYNSRGRDSYGFLTQCANFTAYNSSTIYNYSNTVQPSALYTLIIIKA